MDIIYILEINFNLTLIAHNSYFAKLIINKNKKLKPFYFNNDEKNNYSFNEQLFQMKLNKLI